MNSCLNCNPLNCAPDLCGAQARPTITGIPQAPGCPACGFIRSHDKSSQSKDYQWEVSWVPKCRACGDTGTLRDEHGQEPCPCRKHRLGDVALAKSPDKCFEALVIHNNAAVQLAHQRLIRINELEWELAHLRLKEVNA